ncbi:MAG: hypothetical protein IJB73_05485 [Firmicutes bacterium]|nr:hypothetical protein [Bacillota bacterium]
MAKFEKTIVADFDEFARYIENEVMSRSMSATLEDRYEKVINDVRIQVSAYERYSYAGGNRVSMNVTLMGHDRYVDIVAITTGGSQAVFWKVNTWGETAFLETLVDGVDAYIANH